MVNMAHKGKFEPSLVNCAIIIANSKKTIDFTLQKKYDKCVERN